MQGFLLPQNQGYHFGGPYKKDYSIWGSILGSLYLWKLPFRSPGVCSLKAAMLDHQKNSLPARDDHSAASVNRRSIQTLGGSRK